MTRGANKKPGKSDVADMRDVEDDEDDVDGDVTDFIPENGSDEEEVVLTARVQPSIVCAGSGGGSSFSARPPKSLDLKRGARGRSDSPHPLKKKKRRPSRRWMSSRRPPEAQGG